MTAGWVGATTRGRALLGTLIGDQGAATLARESSWADARGQLRATIYGADLSAGADRATARREAGSAAMWQLRVLAGWLPPASGRLARLATAPFEIVNIDDHVARLDGATPRPPFDLGSLTMAWPRVATTTSIEQVRSALAHSVWGDPGGNAPHEITLGLRVAWARRTAAAVPIAHEWALGAVASLITRERFAFGREIPDTIGRDVDRLLGRAWRAATSLDELATHLPTSASWVLDGVTGPGEVWRTETTLLHRVAQDAQPIATSGQPSADTVAAIMALMLVDLWRVTAAVEAAGRGPLASEVLDAVA